MHLLLSLGYFILFGFLLKKISFFRNLPGLSYPILVLFFTLKVMAGMFLIYIYTYYYTDPEYADIYKYFNDGRILFSALNENPWDYLRLITGIDASASHLAVYYEQMSHWYRPWESPLYNDNRLMIRFNALAFLFSGGSIWVHNVFINVLSFTGLVGLYRFFLRYSDQSKVSWLLIGVFLFPSLLFWGSGILKEGLLLWSFGLWIYYFDNLLVGKKGKLNQSILLLFFTFILLLLKPYTLFLWLPCMLAFYISRNLPAWKVNMYYGLIIMGCIVMVLMAGYFFPSFDILQVIASKHNEYIAHSLHQDAGSLIHTRVLTPELWDVTRAFFMGIIYALFRPHLFEAYSPVTLMASIENLLIVFLLLYMLLFYDRKKLNQYEGKWAGLWFSLLLLGLTGMISVAYGGIVRYKIPALPFLWFFWVHSTKLPALHLKKIVNKWLSRT